MQSKILDKKRLPITSLHEFQGDFKTLGKKQFEKLKKSIQKNGFIQPFFIWKSGDKYFILDGHQRKKAIIDLYGDTIDVDCLEIKADSELEAKKFVLYYSTSYAEFDKDSFFNFADGLTFDDLEAFQFPNFSFSENDFLKGLNSEQDDEIPETAQNELGVQLGDIYTLGDHRLMCGDSTDNGTVQKLMDGNKADMVFTDPPYGMNYSGRGKKTSNEILNDDGDVKEFYDVLKYAKEVYLWGRFKNYKDLPSEPKNMIIWKKNNFGMGKGYRSQYECCFYWGSFSGSDSNVWEINTDTDYDHPTQKPTALAERAISNSNPKTILDLFGGSGSTLIACEKTKRKCYMMELDPHYCSVIIKRWEKYTGKKAVKCE